MLPRLSNVLAVYLRSESQRARCENALRSEFPVVRVLESGWLVAERALPDSAPARCMEPASAVWEGERELLEAELHARSIDEIGSRLYRLQGEVGFARLEPGGRFLLARSAGGLVATYVAVDGASVWIATSLQDLLRCREAEPRSDALVQALWSEGNSVFPDNRTFFQGIQSVPRGHAAIGTPDRLTWITYWDPRPERLDFPDKALTFAHTEQFRDILLNTLSASLSADHPNLLTLSGGIDSSSMAYLAHHLGFGLTTLTLVAPRRSSARAVQLSYVQSLVAELGIENARLVDAEDEVLEELFQRPLPALFFCPHPGLRLLPEVAPALGARVLFSGHFADEVAGYSQRLQDWITHTPARRLFDPRYPRPAGWRDLGRWFKRRTLERLGHALLPFPREVGPWFLEEVREEAQEWSERERRAATSDPRPLRELAAYCRLDGWVAMHWECCSRWGMRPSTPFFTRRMLELAFRCHPTELFGPGTKKILRSALAGLVPPRYLERSDKGHWNIQWRPPTDRRLTTGLPDDVRALLRNEYPTQGAPPTVLEHRALSQLVLFSRKVREVRHAAYGRD